MTEVQISEADMGLRKGPEATVNEVRRLVYSEGACQKLDSIRVRQLPFRESQRISKYDEELAEKSLPYLPQAEQSALGLRPVLSGLLENQGLLHELANLPEGTAIIREALKKHLGTSSLPLTERLDFLFNHNIDPELIPFALANMGREASEIPNILVQTLAQDEFLRRRLAIVLISLRSRALGKVSSPDSITHEINGFINETAGSLSKNPQATQEQISSLREYLQGFFDPEGKQRITPALEFANKLQNISLRTYFEMRHRDHQILALYEGETERWFPHSAYNNIPTLEDIKQHAKAAENGRYLLLLYQRTKNLYSRFLPEIYEEPDIDHLKLVDPRPSERWGSNFAPIERFEDVNGAYHPQEKSIDINSGTLVTVGGEEAFDEETYTFATDKKMRRRVTDTVIMAHELTHAVYDKVIGKHSSITREDNYQQTADHAINEGFAVMMELLLIDVLKANPGLLNLDQRDLEDLEIRKKARLFELKKQKNGYTEGTYRILHRVYTEGAGRGNQRDMRAGLTAIRQFIHSLNPDRTRQVLRTDPQYIALLRNGTPAQWQEYFSQVPREALAEAA